MNEFQTKLEQECLRAGIRFWYQLINQRSINVNTSCEIYEIPCFRVNLRSAKCISTKFWSSMYVDEQTN